MIQNTTFAKYISLLIFLSVIFPTKAVIAIPHPVNIQMPDGSYVTVQRYGDEFFHYTKDDKGYIVKQKDDGFYYYANFQQDGYLLPTDDRIGSTSVGRRSTTVPTEAFQRANEMRTLRAEQMANSIRMLRSAKEEVTTKTLVLLVSFSDKKFSYTQNDFYRLLNERNYSYNGATGSVRDYYRDNSMGTFDPSFVLKGPYTLSHPYSYYGANNSNDNDQNATAMVEDAVRAAYEDGLDLRDLDGDGDGYVDNIFVYYAGYNEAEGADKNTIWPHASTMVYTNVDVGGVKLASYACTSELKGTSDNTICGIGAFCHEYGHTLGLKDLYDTDGSESGGRANGVGNISLMNSGNYNNQGRTPPCLNAEERLQLGWLIPESLSLVGGYDLPAIHKNRAYKVETGNEGEYYLFENRQKVGWDTYISGHGMAIYHVDKSNNYVSGKTAASLWSSNAPNVNPAHQCFDLLRADGSNSSNISGAFYPGTSNQYTEFSYQTKPSAKAWTSLPLGIRLYDIAEVDSLISFQYKEDNVGVYVGGLVADKKGEPISSALLYLTPMADSKPGSGLRMATAVNEETRTATSNSSGQYIFDNVSPGSYQLICRSGDYMDNVQTIQVEDGIYTCNFTMETAEERYYAKTISWHGDLHTVVGCGGEDFSAAVRWTASDLIDCVGLKVGSISVYIYTGNPTVDVYLMLAGDTVAQKHILSSNISAKEYLTVDFMEDSVVVNSKEELRVICKFSNYSEDGYPIGIDSGPTVIDKGNLVYEESSGWSDLSRDDISANWMITVDLYEQPEYVAVESFQLTPASVNLRVGKSAYLLATVLPADATYRNVVWTSSDSSVVDINNKGYITGISEGSAVITATTDLGRRTESCVVQVKASIEKSIASQVSQHAIYVDWSDGDAQQWKFSWKLSTDSLYCYADIEESEFCIDSLLPGTTYDILVEAYSGEEMIDEYKTRLVTQEIHTFPMAIYIVSATPKSGKKLVLDISNLPEEDTVVRWFLDNKEVLPPLLLMEQGTHILKAEIITAENGTETIQRKIIVTE